MSAEVNRGPAHKLPSRLYDGPHMRGLEVKAFGVFSNVENELGIIKKGGYIGCSERVSAL